MKIRDAVIEYLADLPSSRAKGTKSGYRQKLMLFADWCEQKSISLEELGGRKGNQVVNAFTEYLHATRHSTKKTRDGKYLPVDAHTVREYVVCIKMLLNWCLEDSDEFGASVKVIAVKRIKIPDAEKKIVDIFTPEQVRSLLLACLQEYNEHLRLRNKAIILLFLCTGIRVAELCSLTIRYTDLSADNPYVKVMGKGRKEREIPLDKETRRVLSTYKRKYRAEVDGDEPFFVDRSLSRKLSTSAVEQLIEKLGLIAEIKGVRCSPHTFRHYFATWFIRNGGDVLHLSRLMGHRSLAITEKYIQTLSSLDIRMSLRLIKGERA